MSWVHADHLVELLLHAAQRQAVLTMVLTTGYEFGTPTPHVLHATRLRKSYGALMAVEDISLSARPGEILALLGRNGAGKSTFMNMLAGVLRPDGGALEIMGVTGRGLPTARQQHMGFCPQRSIIWRDLTCQEQLSLMGRMYGLSQRTCRTRAAELLASFELTGKRDALAAHLSGGMQRRLSLALAMMHEPKILILDEPAAGLDPHSRVLVRSRVRALSREGGKTVMVSTHDMDEAERIADRVAIIDHGRVLVTAAPDQLKAHHGSSNIIEVDLPTLAPDQYEDALGALAELHTAVRRVGERILLDVDHGAELLRPIQLALSRLSITPTEVRFRPRSLEDVFLELTGGEQRP